MTKEQATQEAERLARMAKAAAKREDWADWNVLQAQAEEAATYANGLDTMKTIDQQLDDMIPEWTQLIESLIPDICDDYRASDDPADDVPGMQLTIGFTPTTAEKDCHWHYQTGDNSYSGGAYGHPHWAVVSLYRDSDAAEVAEEIASQIGELVCS